MRAPSHFTAALAERNSDPQDRRWLYIPYDQLTDRIGPLSNEDPHELGIILIECPAKAARRPYHKQKLALVLANQRRFALEQAERGVAVRHEVARTGFGDALRPLAGECGPIRVMRPAERELREDIAPLVRAGALEVLPHEGWLTTPELFARSAPKGPPWRMDAFYRAARRESGVLMTREGKPTGGKFSFDAENRERWDGQPPAPDPPRFDDDPVKSGVLELVEKTFAQHPGQLDGAFLPTSAADAAMLWAWALRECLPHFGPFEDAMSLRSRGLFHTRISPLLNLHRLLPREVVQAASLALGRPCPRRLLPTAGRRPHIWARASRCPPHGGDANPDSTVSTRSSARCGRRGPATTSRDSWCSATSPRCSTCRRANSRTGSGWHSPMPTIGSWSRTCWAWRPLGWAICSRPSPTCRERATSTA